MIGGGEISNRVSGQFYGHREVVTLERVFRENPESVVLKREVERALAQGKSFFQDPDDYYTLQRLFFLTPWMVGSASAARKFPVLRGGLPGGSYPPARSPLGGGWVGLAIFGSLFFASALSRWRSRRKPSASIELSPLAPQPGRLPWQDPLTLLPFLKEISKEEPKGTEEKDGSINDPRRMGLARAEGENDGATEADADRVVTSASDSVQEGKQAQPETEVEGALDETAKKRSSRGAEVFLREYFGDGIDDKSLELIDEALSRGIITIEKLVMVFESLKAARFLPLQATPKFLAHVIMWLEITNQLHFIPVITGSHRLDDVIDLLRSSWNSYVDLTRGGPHLLDVGGGYLPFTAARLAQTFPNCQIYSVDLFLASHIVADRSHSKAIFDGEDLKAVHADNAKELHDMVLNWERTTRRFLGLMRALKAQVPEGQSFYRDPWSGEITMDPIQPILRKHPNLTLVRNTEGGFDLPSLTDNFDVIWAFNVLLHYDREPRREALFALSRKLKPAGIVIEGYTSPSGKTAVYAIWRKTDSDLVMQEFGFSSPNFQYPLWPLRDRDYLVDLLNVFVALVKANDSLMERIIIEYPVLRSEGLSPELMETIRVEMRKAGYEVEINGLGYLVIRFTGKHKIRLRSLFDDIEEFISSRKPL